MTGVWATAREGVMIMIKTGLIYDVTTNGIGIAHVAWQGIGVVISGCHDYMTNFVTANAFSTLELLAHASSQRMGKLC